jgi:hypothetical protein
MQIMTIQCGIYMLISFTTVDVYVRYTNAKTNVVSKSHK